ncbi:MAG: 6-carboxytetrahydropterin synthase QueD [Chloroflexi bacterium]|nr:6-carboxytetrahydropterin synthase QueD [Chloroflexota bacterium]
MEIGREFNFDSAHKLEGYEGSCRNLHGHTYKLHVILKGDPASDGMVMDFSKLKETVEKKVISILDHNYLNDIIPVPTAENIAVFIWKKLEADLPLFEIKLWESPNNWVTVRAEDIR